MIAAVVDEQRLRAPGTDLRLSVSCDARVALDHAALSSIVGNLVSNAVEVSDGAGPVEVTLSCDDGMALVSVADRGPGLPDGDVFTPFFSTKAQGTGLGLWLVRRLALEAGGDVAAGDREGRGAVFTVRLPIADRARLAGRQVLVVDDDQHLTNAVAAALRDAGCTVDGAARAEDVVGRRGELALDCAVLDFRLPGMNGVEAASRRSAACRSSWSRATRPPRRRRSPTSGKDNAWFMAKPFPMDDLLDALSLLVAAPLMSIRVIIADDHALWRAGLAQILEAEGLEVAAQASTGDEALDSVRDNPGAVLLLDIAMPGRLDGLATSARLKERGDDVKVIIVSGRDDRDALFSAITAGARGYIAKDAEPAQLLGAIHLVAGGGSAFGGSVAEGLAGGVTGLDYSPGEYERRRLDLSERELQILRLLATPLTAAQIGSQLFLSTKTVQNHTSSIYRKLGVGSRSEAVVKAMELHFISGGSS